MEIEPRSSEIHPKGAHEHDTKHDFRNQNSLSISSVSVAIAAQHDCMKILRDELSRLLPRQASLSQNASSQVYDFFLIIRDAPRTPYYAMMSLSSL